MGDGDSVFPLGGQLVAGSTMSGYRAIQLDVAVTIVDWPVVHAWSEGDPDFVGEVTVVDEVGVPLARVVWPAPTDVAADRSLNRVGWGRVGAWMWDWAGRRVATVAGLPSVSALHGDRPVEGGAMVVMDPVVSGQGYTVIAVDGADIGALADFTGHKALTVQRSERTYRLVGDGAEHSGAVRFHQKHPGLDDKDVRVWTITERGGGTFMAVPAAEF